MNISQQEIIFVNFFRFTKINFSFYKLYAEGSRWGNEKLLCTVVFLFHLFKFTFCLPLSSQFFTSQKSRRWQWMKAKDLLVFWEIEALSNFISLSYITSQEPRACSNFPSWKRYLFVLCCFETFLLFKWNCWIFCWPLGQVYFENRKPTTRWE